jgi:glycosyltransferase involved in cell wall biosynthesis
MRILQVTEYFWPQTGGAPIADAHLAAALVAAGHEVTVITDLGAMDLPAEGEYRGVMVRRFGVRRALSAGGSPAELLDLLRSVDRIARDFEPDLLHATMMAGPALFLVARLADRSREIPVVVTFQREVGENERTGPDTLLGRVLRRAGAITCVSDRTRGQLVAACPEVAARVRTVHPGLPDPGPPPNLPSEPHLLCLGRLVELKGFDLAIAAVARLLEQRGRWPDLVLTIAGDGPEREALERLAQATGVAGRVRFLGEVPRDGVPSILASARLVLLPSHTEGLPLVAIEAALAGRPVVAAEVGGMAEVVRNGETGLLVPAGDAESLARAIARLLDDAALAERFGGAARFWAMERFLLGVRVDTYTRLYASLMEGSDG